ncbi:MAG: hypothetical protein COA57_15825 [Flavobacteriales bacterium]|nr:MarR family transcriptional regulator [Bacteroidales bacterium AH-315-I05]PCJ79230.1 MAG: hypothetical protein COA57_15825 [Flavobacteriales bacterium]
MNVAKADKDTLKINPKMCPFGRLTIISRKLGKLFKKHFKKLNVTQSQATILLMLAEMGEILQSDIGKHLELERSTVSRDLVRLIDNGYLNKTASGVSPTISLTKEGIKLAKLVTNEWGKGYKDSFQVLGNEGMNAVATIEQTMKR